MIRNEANQADEVVSVNRSQIEHRATWMALIYDEMKKAGIDAEPIIRRAIRRTGRIHGENFRGKCPDPSNCEDFEKAFLGGEHSIGPRTFNMKNIRSDRDNVTVNFNYCALVAAWQKLGFDDATIDLLCDMAMEGDRGIADAMGLELDLGDTIAKGRATCDLHFKKQP
ncbi:MAG TPA: L-2-amino-thiazoline-4-carboxylic acid hydrolase [Candidatus Limnocylindria bacterium]|nr:L-2-amino-thiazoline-4-carboxylic acid hydrolase [Candidatus Limnocylindria bacterium]